LLKARCSGGVLAAEGRSDDGEAPTRPGTRRPVDGEDTVATKVESAKLGLRVRDCNHDLSRAYSARALPEANDESAPLALNSCPVGRRAIHQLSTINHQLFTQLSATKHLNE
jgi:hypothetical protein